MSALTHTRLDLPPEPEPVGGRVKQGVQPAGLVEPAGQPAVQPVDEAAGKEHDQDPAVGLGSEQQPREQRDAGRSTLSR